MWLASSSAVIAGDLPDLNKTPGLTTALSEQQICATKWGKDARHVDTALKASVFRSYGYAKLNKDPRCPCEIDHLISRELGGADDVRNLWPQSYRGDWNARMKDRLENLLHSKVCKGSISLEAAQTAIKTDWIAAYKKWVVPTPHKPKVRHRSTKLLNQTSKE